MKSHGLLIVSKESWGDIRWARKQWLPYYLSRQDDFKRTIYMDRHSAWWRGESAHPPGCHQKVEVVQERLTFPFERNPGVRRWNRERIAKRMTTMLDEELMWSTIYYHPFDVVMMPHLAKRSEVIFDWTEDWAVFHDDTEISELQIRSVREADAVITVTQQLYERAVTIRGGRESVFHVPNATALERSDEKSGEPEELEQLGHPRIGFIGHAGPWFDGQLVAEIAGQRPHWQWVMVGGCGEDAARQLYGLSNIHWQGVQPPEKLLSFMQHCDLLVAPYKKGIEGDATKLYDYLVAARPIITIPCETAELLQPWVSMCQNSSEWMAALDHLLSGSGASSYEPCPDEVTSAHHWHARAEVVAKIIAGMRDD